MMVQQLLRHREFIRCNTKVDVWIIANQGPNSQVQVLSGDSQRLFIGFSIQSCSPPNDDLVILGGELAGGARMGIGASGHGEPSIQNFTYNYWDHGSLMQGPVVVQNVSSSGHLLVIVTLGCLCPIRDYGEPDWEYDCKVTYDIRTSSVSVTAASGPKRLFQSNPNRLSLIVSVTGTPPGPLTISTGEPLGGWYESDPPWNNAFPYRDYGPLIQREVWASTGNAGTLNVTATEVFKIPDMR